METTAKIPVDILWVADTVQKDTYQVKAHTHDYYCHLVYIRQGRCRMVINDEPHELTAGMVAIAMPDDLHYVASIPTSETIRLVEVKFVVNSGTLSGALGRSDRVFPAGDFEQTLLDRIIKNGYAAQGRANVNASRSYLTALLYAICEEHLNEEDLNPDSFCLRGIDTTAFSPVTLTAVQYIEENYMQEISLEKIGQKAGCHKNYVSTIVKSDLGINVNELITFVRVHKAANLLYHGDYSVRQVCELTGFKDVSHFTRTFRKMVGIPPAHYRNSYPDTAYDGSGFDARCTQVVPVWLNGLLRDYIESK